MAAMKTWLTVVAMALFTAGCSPSVAGYCDDKCDCEGCSDNDYDECLDKYEDEERHAENRDCLDYWDDLMACRGDTAFCKDGHEWEDDCGPEKDRFKNCVD